jgi:hypothetical protein
MISDLKTILETVSSILEKRHATVKDKTRDRVLTAIYQLGDNGSSSVGPEELERAGFTKLEVIDSIMAAKDRDWIIDCSSKDGMSWLLKREAVYYIQALLEASGLSPQKKCLNSVERGPDVLLRNPYHEVP